MEYVKSLFGNTTPQMLKYQIGEAMAKAGVPVVIGGAGNEGVALAATTTASDLVGITQDAQPTLVTAQQSDNSDPAREVNVVVDPNAVYRARLSGGAAEGTVLAAHTVDTADATGLSIETDASFASPEMDEGSVFCHSGANIGIGRKITSTSGNHAILTVALPHDIEIGDVFIKAPYCASPYGMETQFVQLTTALTELNASVAVDTDNNNFRVLELLFRDNGDDPDRGKSHALIVAFDSIFAAGGSI